MSDGLIITLDEFKAWLGPEALKSSEKDDILSAFILAGEEAVRTMCSQNFDRRTYANEYHNGQGKLHIKARELPVLASPLPTVTENGTALVVAAGYSATADVTFNPDTGWFTRQATTMTTPGGAVTPVSLVGGWAPGWNNLALGYTAGYLLGAAPADLRLLIKYVAGMTWQQTDRKEFTIKTRSGQQGSTTFYDSLPPFYQSIVSKYSVPILGE